jgi:hypothetical protein
MAYLASVKNDKTEAQHIIAEHGREANGTLENVRTTEQVELAAFRG